MVGLFTRRAGQARNEPIARTGIIAGIPSEPLVNARTNGPMYGCYLAVGLRLRLPLTPCPSAR